MLPPQFDYVVAGSVAEAVNAKAEYGDEARFIAGGQSLLPLMKLRFASPAQLVDINRIEGLGDISRSNGHLSFGALARHADVVASDATFGAISAAAPWVADPLVRNLGTLCGSVAHCDPEGDWNSVMLATGATVNAVGPSGERAIAIGDFVQGPFTNALADDEMVTSVTVPVPAGRSGGEYLKLERKVGDYATVGVAAHLELAADGSISLAGIALTSVASANLKVTEAEAALVGQMPTDDVFAAAGEVARNACEPRSDVRGTAEWKRQVVATFTARALRAAADQAQAG